MRAIYHVEETVKEVMIQHKVSIKALKKRIQVFTSLVPVLDQFDGKVVNKRFNDALLELHRGQTDRSIYHAKQTYWDRLEVTTSAYVIIQTGMKNSLGEPIQKRVENNVFGSASVDMCYQEDDSRRLDAEPMKKKIREIIIATGELISELRRENEDSVKRKLEQWNMAVKLADSIRYESNSIISNVMPLR